MSDPKFQKPGVRPHTAVPQPPSGGAAGSATPGKPAAPTAAPSGKVVHDSRGNAVWDFLKETSRIAIESTTRMLKKLEAPDLKMEETGENELRLMPDGKAGGGYDPYNQATKPKKPLKK
jgi:hypothetical protein